MKIFGVLFLVGILLNVSCADSLEISVKAGKWKAIRIPIGLTSVTVTNLDTSLITNVVLQATGMKRLCISRDSSNRLEESFCGESVGMEKVFLGETEVSLTWYISSNISQFVFLTAKGYSNAPVVGVCSKPPTRIPLDPNLHMNYSSLYFNEFSLSYATIFESNTGKLMKCDDKAYWPQLTYDIYVLPWNLRFENSHPRFNSSSIYHLSDALFYATSMNVLREGSLLHSFKMKSLDRPRIRFWNRLGMDYILSVVVRANEEYNMNRLKGSSDVNGFYVTQVIYGCRNTDCAVVGSTWTIVFVGVLGVAGLLFAHLGRRIHRINTFFSGLCLGAFMVFALLSQLTNLGSKTVAAISLFGGGLGFGLMFMLASWKCKPSNKLSHFPLYLTASFLIVSSLFFTPLGNQRYWVNQDLFYGVFFGLWIGLSLLVFVPLTNKISVDLCVAIVGSYMCVFAVMAIFFSGSVFPYLLLDSVFRVSIPGGHNTLSISWIYYTDIAAFIVWPSLIIIFLLLNHFCTPPLEPSSEEPEARPEHHYNHIYQNADTWPPLPPDAYVSERTPLILSPQPDVPNRSNSTATFPSAPPPYTNSLIHDNPPAYSSQPPINFNGRSPTT